MTSPLHTFARRGTVIVASLATAALALSVSPASAADTGHLAGTVTVAAGDIATADIGATAYEYDATYEDWSYVSGTTVGPDGTFDISGLDGGTYRVEFTDYSGDFIGESYDNAATLDAATDIDVAPGEIRSGIDAELAVATHVTGQVTDAVGPLDGISVTAYTQLTDNGESYWSSTSYGSTDALGNYDLGGLRPGTYRVGYYDQAGNFVSEYYDNARDLDSAANITVGTATVPGIDAQLAVGSHVTGQVTGTGGALLGDVAVSTFAQTTVDGYTSWEYFGDGATTDVDGNYDVGGLPAGTYRLQFYDFNGDYATEYYDNATVVENATDVVVGTGVSVPGKDAELEPAGHITGQITDAAGPLSESLVVANTQLTIDGQTIWYSVGFGFTDASGNYSIDDLRAGTYRLEFLTFENTHVAEYYDNVDSIEAATDVVVAAGDTVAGKSAQLAKTTEDTPPAPPVVVPPVVVPPVVTPPVTPAAPLTDVDDSSKPKVQGAKKVGSTLKAKVASWIPAGATVKYQWLVNGKAIKKATKAKLKVTKKLKGKKVSVKVIATSPGSVPVAIVTKVGKIK